MIEVLALTGALTLPVSNSASPAAKLDERVESAAAVSASLRIEPFVGEVAIREAAARGVWSRDAKSGPRWIDRTPFSIEFDAGTGALSMTALDGVLRTDRFVGGELAAAGPNLVRIEVASLDPSGFARLENLVLRVAGEEIPLRDFGRGAMGHDLATLWEPRLSAGFRVEGELVLSADRPERERRVWVDFGLGRGHRVEVEVAGAGAVRSEPAGLVSGASKSAVGYFRTSDAVRLEAIAAGDFLGWSGEGIDASATELALAAGDGASFWTARFTESPDRARTAAARSPQGLIFENNSPITIPDSGNGNPYPSTIVVSGPVGGAITDVNVVLDQVSHTFPDDLDVLVVSPIGDTVVVMSDACGDADVANFIWRFDDEAAAPLPDAGPCFPINNQPTNIDNGVDTWGAPAPAGPHGSVLSDFDQENPNGTWSLFVVDDAAGDSGSIASGWTLELTLEPYAILIPATGTSGPADDYPSTLNVVGSSTLFGSIVDVDVTLVDMTHSHGDDLDVLVQGPSGSASILMSDACGSQDFLNYLWTFDDEAAAPMSDSDLTGCNPFVVQPTDYSPGDVWPAPATAGPHTAALTVFDGQPGLGSWHLFVNDDAGADEGFLEDSWSVDLTLTGIFRDGFEAGDLCTWSSNSGGGVCP
jgi:subtilisin-like proprotein convertase family protein